jgi:hypothetical protein
MKDIADFAGKEVILGVPRSSLLQPVDCVEKQAGRKLSGWRWEPPTI